MLIVGLTGAIGSGKTCAARIFSRLGVRLVDSDVLARKVVGPGTPALAAIKGCFGDEVIRGDGSLDREKLRDIVFHDASALKDLNTIVHPAVYAEIAREMANYRKEPRGQILMLDIPLLYESRGETLVDVVVVVYVDRETQVRRLMARDSFSREEAINRIEAQMDLEKKKGLADFVIDNRGSMEELEKNVRKVYAALVRLDEQKGRGSAHNR